MATHEVKHKEPIEENKKEVINCEPKKPKIDKINIDSDQDDIISIEDEIYNLAFRPSKTFNRMNHKLNEIKSNQSDQITMSHMLVTSTKPTVKHQSNFSFNFDQNLIGLARKDFFMSDQVYFFEKFLLIQNLN